MQYNTIIIEFLTTSQFIQFKPIHDNLEGQKLFEILKSFYFEIVSQPFNEKFIDNYILKRGQGPANTFICDVKNTTIVKQVFGMYNLMWLKTNKPEINERDFVRK
jgi:hypothetical protein